MSWLSLEHKMRSEELDLQSTPLFTLIFEREGDGGLVIENIELSDLFMKFPMEYQHKIINEVLGEGEPVCLAGGSINSSLN